MRVDSPPFARPIIYYKQEEEETKIDNDRRKMALDLIKLSLDNHQWRQKK